MSTFEKAYVVIKNAMLMNERFDALQADIKDIGSDIAMLGRSHAELAERVARIEGFIQGAAAAADRGSAPRIEG